MLKADDLKQLLECIGHILRKRNDMDLHLLLRELSDQTKLKLLSPSRLQELKSLAWSEICNQMGTHAVDSTTTCDLSYLFTSMVLCSNRNMEHLDYEVTACLMDIDLIGSFINDISNSKLCSTCYGLFVFTARELQLFVLSYDNVESLVTFTQPVHPTLNFKSILKEQSKKHKDLACRKRPCSEMTPPVLGNCLLEIVEENCFPNEEFVSSSDKPIKLEKTVFSRDYKSVVLDILAFDFLRHSVHEFNTLMLNLIPHIKLLTSDEADLVRIKAHEGIFRSHEFFCQKGSSQIEFKLEMCTSFDVWKQYIETKGNWFGIPILQFSIQCVTAIDFAVFEILDFFNIANHLFAFLIKCISNFKEFIYNSPSVILFVFVRVLSRFLVLMSLHNMSSLNGAARICLSNLSKFISVFCTAESKKIVGKSMAAVICSYVECIYSLNLPSSLKDDVNCIPFACLTVIDKHAFQQLKMSLKSGPREMLKDIYRDYQKFYQFTGDV